MDMSSALILVGLFFIGIAVPCILVAWIGFKFIGQLGQYPSKTPSIQMSICLKLFIIEVATFTVLFALFKVLAPAE